MLVPFFEADWSTDGRHIQSSCVAYELLFHDITADLVGSKQNTSATAVGARYAHDCQLASSFPFIGVSTPVVLMFGGMTDAGPTNDLIAFDDVNSRVCPQTDGEAKAISTRAIISSPSFIGNHTTNTYSD
jgi:hypothetical protein